MRLKLPVIFAIIGLGLPLVAATAHADEPYCREYTRNVTVGGKQQESYGTACMKPDGSWEVQNAEPARTVTAPTVIREEVITYVHQPRPVYVRPSPVYTVISFGDRGRDRGRDRYHGHYGHGHGHSHGYGHGYKRPNYYGNGYSHHYSNGYSFNFKF